MGALKGENNEEKTEKGQFKMMKNFGKKAFHIPAIFEAFFGESDHCFWQMC